MSWYILRLNRITVREGERGRKDYASAARVELDEELTRPGPSGGSTSKARAGSVPVLFAVEGTPCITTAQYPINRPLHHADDTPLGEEMAAVFKDLNLLLINLINNGAVLRYPVDDDGASPPGSGFMLLDMEMPYRRKMPLQTSLVAADLHALFWQW
ncbi:hypothetical protein GSI_07352 [Ganoderma sinense ZZ0214-1]|uniref:Uncharacterized protein n=1 Tax=Ganoderma sinense ZZ0214-1 TaxID=1077348 RepID=A0A2G8SA61_9APHY|nr:hypothetical protein GSI_07352 [Ganoderma sinense ZZ0214-1]